MAKEVFFSDDDLRRPIFTDPPGDIGREDAWGGPYAFLIGGMGDPTRKEIAREYFNAAEQLVRDIFDQRVEDYTVAMPILFLYRHAIELAVKAAMKGGDGHDLNALAEWFQSHIKASFGEDVPDWIIDRLREVAEIDPRSTSFRYAVKSRSKKEVVPLGGEHFIDLSHLRRSMAALFRVLDGLPG